MILDKNVIKKYLDGKSTDKENALLEEWFENLDIQKDLSKDKLNKHLMSLDTKIKHNNTKSLNIWKWGASVAASILLGWFIYLYIINTNLQNTSVNLVVNDVKAPSESNAIIVLEDLSEINVDSLRVGDTVQAVGYLITKLANGELDYILDSVQRDPIYHILKTNSGGVAHIKLSDGTFVWLNANSELKYPVKFDNEYREVELKGEAYFEVKSAKSVEGKPFYVRSAHQTIKVLGTKFNVNLYSKNITSLLEGKIAISNQNLKSNQLSSANYTTVLSQNQVYDGENIFTDLNIEKYIDWKNGYFDLDDHTVQYISEKIADWYGVNIKVDDAVADIKLFGKISRRKDLKEVLELIEEVADVRFEVRDENLYIIKN